jgi:hypothetical protein
MAVRLSPVFSHAQASQDQAGLLKAGSPKLEARERARRDDLLTKQWNSSERLSLFGISQAHWNLGSNVYVHFPQCTAKAKLCVTTLRAWKWPFSLSVQAHRWTGCECESSAMPGVEDAETPWPRTKLRKRHERAQILSLHAMKATQSPQREKKRKALLPRHKTKILLNDFC